MAREYVLDDFHPRRQSRIDFQAALNPQQLAAATAPPGPALVLAGAGSGKTRTLTYRVAYLLDQGVPAERILLLTFTNKAAREMMQRVTDLAGAETSQLWGGTFHSIGARILRANAESLGFRGDFTILDREDAESVVKACLGSMGDEPKGRMLPKPEVLADALSRAANERRPLRELFARRHAEWGLAADWLDRLAAQYRDRKRALNAMDFDDLLALWLELLETHPGVRERYQHRFQWVLVDEYQDTNRIQGDLLDLLVAPHRNLMAVGDDSQSIYSWRGANFLNILEFPRRYPDARVFKVETNYRSTPEILAVANAAIAANGRQFAKTLTPARRSGTKPALVACEDGQQQAAFVARRVIELAEEGVSLADIAVLYRSHFHALELQLELTRRSVPFVITSGIRFFEQAHMKDVAAWLRFVANPADELAFKRVALLLPGIGPKAAEKIWVAFCTAYGSALAASGAPALPLAPTLMQIQGQGVVPKKAARDWAVFATTLSQVEAPPAAGRPGDMLRVVREGFYDDYARSAFPNPVQRLDDLDQLASYAAQFGSVTDFLTQVSLLTQVEADATQRPERGSDDRLRLSTVHQAKGLEFQVVFVIMLGDGFFPSARSLEDPDAEEEERRLFYVAITRAKDELYLTYPLLRSAPGQGSNFVRRSRFLGEIPPDLIEIWNLRPARADAWRGDRDPTPLLDQDAEEAEDQPY